MWPIFFEFTLDEVWLKIISGCLGLSLLGIRLYLAVFSQKHCEFSTRDIAHSLALRWSCWI